MMYYINIVAAKILLISAEFKSNEPSYTLKRQISNPVYFTLHFVMYFTSSLSLLCTKPYMHHVFQCSTTQCTVGSNLSLMVCSNPHALARYIKVAFKIYGTQHGSYTTPTQCEASLLITEVLKGFSSICKQK